MSPVASLLRTRAGGPPPDTTLICRLKSERTTLMATKTALQTITLADDLTITRMGYGAMQLAGPGVFGPPKDRDEAIAVLRAVVEAGVTHIDTR